MRIQANGTVIKGRLLALLFSILVGIVLAGGMLSLIALILTKHEFDERWHFPFVCAAVCFGGILSSFIFTKKSKMKGIVAGLINGTIYASLAYLVFALALNEGASVKLFGLLASSLILSVFSGILARNL